MILRPYAYFDSSVTAKRYLREPGSAQASQLLRRYRFISSRLTTIELRSVFKRKQTDGDIDFRAYDSITKKLESDRLKWELVALSLGILDSAGIVSYSIRYSHARCNSSGFSYGRKRATQRQAAFCDGGLTSKRSSNKTGIQFGVGRMKCFALPGFCL